MQEILDAAERAGASDLTQTQERVFSELEGRLDRIDDQLHATMPVQRDPAIVDPDFGNDDRRAAESSPEVRRAFLDYLRTADDRELRAQGVATGVAGGYLVPTAFRREMVETMKTFSGVRQVAEIITTDEGNDLPYPTNDDTANKGAILAENTQVTEQDVVLGQVTLKAYQYTSKMVRVSLQLLTDSAIDLDSWLARALGTRIGRIQNEHFTTGTGTAQPEGVQTNATIGVTGATGQTTSVVYNDLVDLVHSVDPAYREGPGVAWMMRDTTLQAIRKLRDDSGGAGVGRPLLEISERRQFDALDVVVDVVLVDCRAVADFVVRDDVAASLRSAGSTNTRLLAQLYVSLEKSE